ncbi:condensation domain-containing protein, partial [Paenibacillus ehimensis]|uniref:condensation domain-containing protein n=1 Tax=Paenibacillus ehimensis TaxID=79264 RepID=UPI00056A7A4E
RDELPYWRRLAEEAGALPPLFPPVKTVRRDTVSAVHWISGEVGQALCGEANRAYHTETVHLLLCILGRALGAWRQTPAVLVQLEGHGRERFAPGLDVSRTAGWFTSTFPVLLNAGGEPAEAVVAVKEAVRGVPRRGFGYGALRWLDTGLEPDDKAMLESIRPSVSFNYLGLQGEADDAEVRTEALPAEITVGEDFASVWAMDIVSAQVGSAIRLEIRYPRAMFGDGPFAEFGSLLDAAAREVATFCLGKTGGEKTASDFTVTPLRQEELENILDDLILG